jgi:hypothetical protein
MMSLDFDYEAARNSGYSDEDILRGLQKKGLLKFDLDAALKANHDPSEIIQSVIGKREPVKPVEEQSGFRRLGDAGISLMKGAIGIPEAAVGLADIATFGQAGKLAELAGFRPKEAKAFLDEYLSQKQQTANQKVSDAKGFVGTIGAALENPSTIVHTGLESLPSMGAGGVVARGIGAVSKVAPYIAGAIGEGVVGAGQAAENIRQQTEDGTLSGGQSLAAVASGTGTALFGAAGGRVAKKLDIADIDTVLASGPQQLTSKGVARRILEGGISEGVFEEMPQSIQEQVWQNAALGKDLMDGVPEAAANAVLVGGAMGGGTSGMHKGKAPTATPELPQTAAVDEVPGAAPLRLENRPDPLISFPDGSVGKQSDVDAFLTSLPEDLRIPARARLFGYEAQTPTVDDIAQAKSIDDAIAAAKAVVDAPHDAVRNDQIDKAWADYKAAGSAQREQEFAAAEQARRDADVPSMVNQQRDQAVEQANAVTSAQGFDAQEPTAMQLAMQQAQARREAVSAEAQKPATIPVQQQESANGTGPIRDTGIPSSGDSLQGESSRGLDAQRDPTQAAQTAPIAAQQQRTQAQVDASVAQARTILNAAGLSGNERLAAIRGVRTGETSLEDLADAHPPKAKNAVSPVAETAPGTGQPPAVTDSSLNRDSSWVIRNKETGEVVLETFDKKKVEALNTEKYEAVPVQKHLGEVNTPGTRAHSVARNEKVAESAPPALKDKHAGKKFGDMGAANAYIAQNRLTKTHKAVAAGRDTYSIQAKDTAAAPAENPLERAARRGAALEQQVATANENTAKRTEIRETAIASLQSMSKKELQAAAKSDRRSYIRVAASDILQEREADSSAKRSKSAKTYFTKTKNIDPNKDSMAQAIAKLGGINKDSAAGRMRLTPEEMRARGNGIMPMFTKNGMSMDQMGAALAELGYVSRDENGKHDQTDYEDKLAEVANGGEVHTPNGTMERAQAAHEAAMEEVGASSEEEYSQIESHADEADAEIERQIDAAFDSVVTNEELSDEDLDAIFGITPKSSGVSEEDSSGPESQSGRGDQAQAEDFGLTGETQEEGRARTADEESRAEKDAADKRAADQAERKNRERRDIESRQDASADNFELGQSAEDSLSGQKPLLSKASNDRDLVITHNLTERNLLHADKMGGIAVPLLAITKKDSSLSGFGEITLIGSRALADPKGYAGTKVFGADIYSPRYPSVQHKVDGKVLKSVNKALANAMQAIGARELYGEDFNDARGLSENTALRYQVLLDNGIAITPARRENGTLDSWATDNLVRRALGDAGLYDAAEAKARELLEAAGAEERIFQGYTNSGNRKYVPHTMENVVKILKKELRGGENYNYGVGSVRAKYTPQFKSIEKIKQEKGRLVSAKEFEAVKDDINKEFFLLSDMLKDSHPASDRMGFSDTVSMAMGDAATMGLPTALRLNGFENVNDEAMADMVSFMEKLRHLPTAYFEAKIVRDVDLSEFSGAVIPKDTSAAARAVLAKRGLAIKEYEGEANRAAAVDEFARELDSQKGGVLFSVPGKLGAGMPAADVTKAITRLRAKWTNFTRVNVVQSAEDLPAEIRERVDADANTEGFYDPKTKSVYLIADNLSSTQRAIFVSCHEVIGHGGLRMLHDKTVNEALNIAGANKFVKDLAAAIEKDRGDVSGSIAVEEALAELTAAVETDDFGQLEDRYGVKVPNSARNGLRGTVARLMDAVKRFLATVTGKAVASVSDADVRDLIESQRAAVEGRESTEREPSGERARASAMGAKGRTIEVDGVRRPITNSKGQIIADGFAKQQAFWRWFGDSKVIDSDGRPLVVYHGTQDDITAFDENKGIKNDPGWLGRGFYFTTNPDTARYYATNAKVGKAEPNILPVYLRLVDPYSATTRDKERGALKSFGGKSEFAIERRAELKAQGHDGVILDFSKGGYAQELELVIFDSEQVKSATGNAGTFDPKNSDIRFSKAGTERMPEWAKGMKPDVQEALRKSGAIFTEQTARQKIDEMRKGALKKLQYGILDQFAPIKDQLGKIPYIMARMAKNADGTLEALMLHGRPHLDKDGGMLVDTTKKGFVETMQQLQGEHDRFFSWLAGRRAKQLKAEGRENLFTDDDITSLSTLNQGTMKDGSSREAAYLKAQKDVAELNKSVLDIAEESGLIDAASRKVWASDFYVPFFRVMEEGVTGPSIKSGLVNQKSIKKLKGGTNNLGDLTQNMLMNWSTLLTSSAKNRAARASLEAAAKIGAATEADETTIRQMGKAASTKAVSFMDGGANRWFVMEDEHLLAAVSALEFNGYNNDAMKVMSAFKNYLTMAVTSMPGFKVRNLIRDSISSIAVSNSSANPFANVWKGQDLLRNNKALRADLIAGGGVFRFGTFMDGNRGEYVKSLIDDGVDAGNILDTAGKMKAFTRKLWSAYQEAGDLSENVNRAALYDKRIKEGASHLEASFEARDLMDFGLSGAWAGVRALNQILPFFNARLQGIYKLGRGYNDDPKRMAAVIGAVALASVALMLAYKDDDDFKKRGDADRNNYWWFKVGNVAYRIPKPFEIGAAGSAVEHFTALFLDSENTDVKRFGNQMGELINGQLAMNPIPQVFRPLVDVYANKDGFTGRPIESMAMQRLRPEDRYTYNTSELARLLSKSGVLVDPVALVSGKGANRLSPVQIDSMLKGYFSGLATLGTAAVDGLLHHTVIDRGEALPATLKTFAGSFAETLPANSSRYVDMLYSAAQDIEQNYASYQNAVKQGDLEKARSIMDGNRESIAKYHMVESLKKNESVINRKIQQVMNSKEMSGKDKEESIRRLREVQDRIARAFEAKRR